MRVLAFLLLICWCVPANSTNSVDSDMTQTVLTPVDAEVDEQTLKSWQLLYQQKKAQLASFYTAEQAATSSVYINALIAQNSPYLLRHSTNPIAWLPWTEDVFTKAENSNKLIFLSIGYSTCHWCHVMESDSFVDVEVASILNQHFLSVKVDRESLPAVDELYTSALTQVKGSSGWPVTAILNAKGEPVFIDSFIEKSKFKRLLNRLHTMWAKNPKYLNQNAANVMGLVRKSQVIGVGEKVAWDNQTLQQLESKTLALLDDQYGGFAGAPKFPAEGMLLFLLDRYARTGEVKVKQALELQLTKMANGGIYDAIHGGWHRYSTDAQWQVPHFEKMLYNQAQLLMVYARAAKMFNRPDFQFIALDTIDFIRNWLYQPNEGLYSAIDAVFQTDDSKGSDGRFYLRNEQQLAQLPADLAKQSGLSSYCFADCTLKGIEFSDLAQAKPLRKLLAKQYQTKPHIDRKIITSWNALAIWALADSYQYLDVAANQKQGIKQFAIDLADIIWQQHLVQNELGRVLYRDSFAGKRNDQGALADHVFLAKAMLALFDITQEDKYLQQAKWLVDTVLADFQRSDGSFAMTKITDDSTLAVAMTQTKDTEVLAAGALMVNVMQQLWRRNGDVELRKAMKAAANPLKARLNNDGLNHLFAAGIIAEVEQKTLVKQQYFAAGKGMVKLNKTAAGYVLEFNLADGWHVNSATPLQDYLRPTKITLPDTSSLKVAYPQGKTVRLGFQKEPLSVFEHRFSLPIAVASGLTSPQVIGLDVQACSNRVCLLPEKLLFSLF